MKEINKQIIVPNKQTKTKGVHDQHSVLQEMVKAVLQVHMKYT
jgi:hypothetical protein